MDLADVNLVDLDRFAAGFPHEVFRFLREHAPVWWHPPHAKAPAGEGFWVISGHAETLAERSGRRARARSTRKQPPQGTPNGSMLKPSHETTVWIPTTRNPSWMTT